MSVVIPFEIHQKIEQELHTAEKSRAAGNEARARICARRAAGLAVQAYYLARGEPLQDTSAYSLLRKFQADPHLPLEWKQIADLLLIKVEKDYTFPAQADVLAETRRLILAIENHLKRNEA